MYTEQLTVTDPNAFITKSSEFKLRRSQSITSLNSYLFKTNKKKSKETLHDGTSTTTTQKFDTSLIYLRLCINCSALLEKKYKSCRDKMTKPVFVAQYDVSKAVSAKAGNGRFNSMQSWRGKTSF